MAGKARIMETIIAIAGEISPTLGKTIDGVNKKLGGLNDAAILTAASVAAIGVATAKAGKYLLDLGSEFDAAADAIRIGTGATGEALDDLLSDFDEVYKSVPTTMEDAGKAIADYNTRLGLTGKELQGLSAQAIQVSDMLGDDLGTVIEESSQAFQQWGINSADMGGAMDYLFKVSQSTGMGFTDLSKNMQSYGAQLQSMGYSFEEAAALMGQLDKAGVNTEEVLGAMKKSVTTLAKDGISASKGMAMYAEKIKNAGSEAQAAAIASEIFGARAGSTMASAIRNGTLSVDDLTKQLLESGETISGASEDTYDFAEKLQLFKQRAEVALKPMANTVFDALNKLMPVVQSALERVMPVIENVVAVAAPLVEDVVTAFAAELENLLPKIESAVTWLVSLGQDGLAFVKDNMDWLIPVVGGLTAAFVAYKAISMGVAAYEAIKTAVIATGATTMSVATVATWALNSAMAVLTSPITLVVVAIGALVAAGIALWKNWDTVKAKAIEFGTKIGEIWGNIKNAIGNFITSIGEKFPIFGGYLDGIWQTVQQVFGNIKGIFTGIIDFVKNVFAGNWSGAWNSIVSIFTNYWSGLLNIVKIPINGIIGAINGMLKAINGMGFTIPDWVPVVGGKKFALNIPEIPMLATGGFTNGVSIAGEAGTEAVISFDPAYRSENIGYWEQAGRLLGMGSSSADTGSINLGGVTFAPNITVQGNANKSDIMAAIEEEYPEFLDMLEEFLMGRRATVYA